MDCNICYYSSLNINRCKCKFKTCFNCIKKIDKLCCINCNRSLNKNILKQVKIETNIFKKHFVISRLNSYDNILIKEIILKIENKKLLRFGTQIFDTSLEYIFKCTICSGYVNVDYICNSCKSNYCKLCEEIILENHICDESTINSVRTIKESYKKCPFCFTYIEKISMSCNDMKCLCCGIYFKWNNLLIDKDGNSNNHYKDSELLKPDLHKIYMNNKKKNDIIDKKKIFKMFKNKKNECFNKEDIKGIKLCNNIINKLRKHLKKINLLEYTYFIGNKQINNKLIEKLYYLYKSVEYYEIIINKIINFKIRYKLNCPNILTSIFFKNLIKTMAKKDDYPDKVKYYLKNVYLNKQNNKTLFDEYFYIPTYKIISDNYIDYALLKILKKFKLCHHVSNYNSKINILNVLVELKITNIIIITNNVSIDEWKTIIHDYILNIIFVPIHKIETLKKNINIVKMFKKKNQEFINENSILIFENNSPAILNNDTINYLSIFVRNFIFNNAYFIFICNGNCLLSDVYCTMYNDLLFCYKNKYVIVNLLLNKFSKNEILDIINKDKTIFFNKTEDFIEKKAFHTRYDTGYFTSVISKYQIDETDDYVIYRLNYTFYILDKKKFDIIPQSHRKCDVKKNCIYCIKCSPSRTKIILNNINRSICCYVHSLSYCNIRPHNIYLIKDKPVFYSISPNLKIINKKFLIWEDLYEDIAFYLEQLGFTIYEIGLIYKYDSFLDDIRKFIIENTQNAELYKPQITNITLNLSDEDIHAINYAYKDYDIVKKYIINFKHLHLKGKMLTEQVYLKYINEYIINNIYKNIIYNTKFIIILEFNKNIEDLVDLLKKNNIENILYIHSKKKKYNILKLFKNSNNHKILILNSNICIPKQNLSNFNINIIFTNKDISNFYLKNDLIYSDKHKYIEIKMS